MVKNKKKKNVQKIFQARLLDVQILPNPWYEEFFSKFSQSIKIYHSFANSTIH